MSYVLAMRSALQQLLEQPHGHEFFQAVRLLQRWFVHNEGLTPEQALGRLRFRNSLAMDFPASEIEKLRLILRLPPEDAEPAAEGTTPALPRPAAGPAEAGNTLPGDSRAIAHVEITPAFFGLLGHAGTLPAFYTELFAQREHDQRDGAARAFLDVFQQRATTLLYQAWRKHRLPLHFELERRNRYLPLVLSLAGMGQSALRDRLHAKDGGVADDTLAYFSGLLQQRPASAAAIERVLSHYFAVPVRLTQFVGRWFTLDRAQQSTLGMAQCALGSNALVGERVWQRDLRMRLDIGPMPRHLFRRFLPGAPAALALREWLTLLTGITLEYEVRLALRAEDVQAAQLGAPEAPRLGWDTFLVTTAATEDRTEAGYDIHASA